MKRGSRTAARRLAIRQLLGQGAVGSQNELLGALRRRGHRVTQTTVSRDLAALGAVKEPGPGGGSYRLAATTSTLTPEGKLARRMRQFVVEIASSGNLVVLKTPPGAAHSVAVALDESTASLAGLMGTIAGDDTIFAATLTPDGGARLRRQLENLMGI